MEQDDPYKNAYVGVDPATPWQSPPINTDAEIAQMKDAGLVPHDSTGQVIEVVEDESVVPDDESADSESVEKADGTKESATEEPVTAEQATEENKDDKLVSPVEL